MTTLNVNFKHENGHKHEHGRAYKHEDEDAHENGDKNEQLHEAMSDPFRGRRQRPQAWKSADPVRSACGEVWGHVLYGRRTNGAVT